MKTRVSFSILLVLVITVAGINGLEKSSGTVKAQEPVWSPEWEVSWDAGFDCTGIDVALDGMGNVFFAGFSRENIDDSDYLVDFPREVEFGDEMYGGAYLSRYTVEGEHAWTKNWPASVTSVATDIEGNVYVGGTCERETDEIPGPPVMFGKNSDGYLYLAKFSPDGEKKWVRFWGSLYPESVCDIEVGWEGQIYVTGIYIRPWLYDSGPGDPINVEPYGGYNIYLMRVTPDGEPVWVRSWGGKDFDTVADLDIDGEGRIYVTGNGYGTIFFDGESDQPEMDEMGGIYVFRFTGGGDLMTYRIWDDEDAMAGTVSAFDSDHVYVTGEFREGLDFRGWPMYESEGDIYCGEAGLSAFILCLDEYLIFNWVSTFCSDGSTRVTSSACDDSGNIYMTGTYRGNVNFKPGTSWIIYDSIGDGPDCFYSMIDVDGNIRTVKTWGSGSWSYAWGMDVTHEGDAFVTGSHHYEDEDRGIIDEIYLKSIPNLIPEENLRNN